MPVANNILGHLLWMELALPHIPDRGALAVLMRRELASQHSIRPSYAVIPTTPQQTPSSIRSSDASTSSKRQAEMPPAEKRPKSNHGHEKNSPFQPLKPMDTNRDIPMKTSQRVREQNSGLAVPESAAHQYITVQTKFIALLKNKLAIVESSSISQDDKVKYHKTVFEPQAANLELMLVQLSLKLKTGEPEPGEKAYEQIDFCSQFTEDEMGRMTEEVRELHAPLHQNRFQKNHQNQQNQQNQLQEIQSQQIPSQQNLAEARPIQQTQSQPNHLFQQNQFQQNLAEARQVVLRIRMESPPPPPAPARPAAVSDDEDNFGEHTMDGLYTSEIDDNYSDLEGFIDDDEALVDGTYHETNNPTQVTEEDSQSVTVLDDLSDNSDVEEIDDFSMQLNEERELQDHDVIEISSGDEDDLVPLPIKTEPKPMPAYPTLVVPPGVLSDLESDLDFSDEDLCAIPDSIPPTLTTGSKIKNPPPGSAPFIDEVYSILQSTFNLQLFRPNQLEAVCATLCGNDTFVLMPTGGGKSLCYQLPALVTTGRTRGTTIVISPLISLMQDQVQHLLEKNIRAGMVSSKGTSAERKQTVELFRSGQLDLVYLSPEMVNASQQIQNIIAKLNNNNQLARIVVDEAHCVSSWGHDFRPDYKGMSMFKQMYPHIPIMALTATANEKVRMDIVHHLNMSNPVLLKQSFNRTNLFYEIKRKNANYLEWIRDYIVAKYSRATGIIYCHSKQLCEQTSEKLNLFGLQTAFYHAGMGPTERFDIQNKWQTGTIRIICATIAFGMGIDKPDVRFVIHLFIPRSLEGYYQETGRAGRDGKPSECIMFYSYKDARSLQSMIQRDADLDREGRENHLNKLRQVVQYCENTTDCRRKQVLHYFNEQFDRQQCAKQCDNCANSDTVTSVVRDVTVFAKDIILLVLAIEKDKVTVLQCQDVFKGLNNSKITRAGYQHSPYHGRGRSLDKIDIERIFFHLLSENCLEEYSVMRAGFASNYVRVGRAASVVQSGQKRVKISFTERVQTTVRGASLTESFVSAREIAERQALLRQDSGDPQYNQLASIRDNLNLGISDASLKEMVLLMPTTKKDFAKIGGINKELAGDFVHFKAALTAMKKGKTAKPKLSQAKRTKQNRLAKLSQRLSQGIRRSQFRSMPL